MKYAIAMLFNGSLEKPEPVCTLVVVSRRSLEFGGGGSRRACRRRGAWCGHLNLNRRRNLNLGGRTKPTHPHEAGLVVLGHKL